MLHICIQPITSPDDFEAVVGVEERAYGADSPMMRLMFPTTTSNISQASRSHSKVSRHLQTWRRDLTVHYVKAFIREESIDSPASERIVGTAVYHVYTPSHTLSEQNPWPESPDEVPQGANQPLFLHYFQILTKARLACTNGRPHAYLANLVVEPSYQGRGIGKKLLEFVIAHLRAGSAEDGFEQPKIASDERDKLACWLDASPSGLKLYQRLGWEEVGTSRFNLEQWGGDEGQVHKNVHMLKWIEESQS